MRPLFPFYGSKWRSARHYGAPNAHVIEPFAGSAGYATLWEPAAVTLIDADPVIVGVWSFLISASSSEIRRLPDLEPGRDVRELGLHQEAAWFIGFWLNRGSATPKNRHTAWAARNGKSASVWGPEIRERVAANVHRIRHWRVQLGAYWEAPRDPAATYFVDPPYVEKGRHYRVNHVSHAAIALWAKQLPSSGPGRVVVCEQEGADWLPFEPLAEVKSTRGTSREVVWSSLSER